MQSRNLLISVLRCDWEITRLSIHQYQALYFTFGAATCPENKVPGTSRISLVGASSTDSLGQKVPGTFSSPVALDSA